MRELLNTWLIRNDTRRPADDYGTFARERGWPAADAALVRRLRDDLRGVVEGDTDPGLLNDWIGRLGLRPEVVGGGVGYRHDGGPAGDLLARVVAAVADGTWRRLKACPDCRWVFYDHTRNGSKRWCLMYAGGPQGRACGTIAKVRRYRDRQAQAGAGTAAPAPPPAEGGPRAR